MIEVKQAAKDTDESVHTVALLLVLVLRIVKVVEGILAQVDSVKAGNTIVDDTFQHLNILD